MPIYEYECTSCGHGFEKLMKNSAEKPGACPACGTENLKKQFSSFSASVARSSSADSCPAAAQCPSGATCPSGGCPF